MIYFLPDNHAGLKTIHALSADRLCTALSVAESEIQEEKNIFDMEEGFWEARKYETSDSDSDDDDIPDIIFSGTVVKKPAATILKDRRFLYPWLKGKYIPGIEKRNGWETEERRDSVGILVSRFAMEDYLNEKLQRLQQSHTVGLRKYLLVNLRLNMMINWLTSVPGVCIFTYQSVLNSRHYGSMYAYRYKENQWWGMPMSNKGETFREYIFRTTLRVCLMTLRARLAGYPIK